MGILEHQGTGAISQIPISGQLLRGLIGPVNTSAFVGTNPTGELITSGSSFIHPESARRDFETSQIRPSESKILESKSPPFDNRLIRTISQFPTGARTDRPTIWVPTVPWATIEIVEHCGNEVLHVEAIELCATAVGHLARGKVDQMSKTGRVAVITGAAQGIGKRTAELLAERGYALLLNDLRSAAETLNAARVPAVEVLEVLGDISDEVVVDKIAAAVRERWGRTDVLVNNAGISLIAPAEKLSAAEYRRVL